MSTTPNPASGSSTSGTRGATSTEDPARVARRDDPAAARIDAAAEAAGARLQGPGPHVRDRLVAAKDRVVHGVQDGRDKVNDQVQKHPMKSLLYAFGAGAVVGLLMRRRGRRG
jgi:ElaB/YqjD/DUF883 family membrane-anchored ribosome-binding protein